MKDESILTKLGPRKVSGKQRGIAAFPTTSWWEFPFREPHCLARGREPWAGRIPSRWVANKSLWWPVLNANTPSFFLLKFARQIFIKFFFIIQWCMGENVWAKYKKGCQYFFFTRKVIIDVSNMERIYGIYKIDNK